MNETDHGTPALFEFDHVGVERDRVTIPTTGSVRFRGADVAKIDPLRLRRRAGMVFQRPTLFGGSLRDNLAVALPGANDGRYVRALHAAALDPALLDRPAAALSGGEAQRACLARTLVTDPEVLLLDEPTAALDAGPKTAFERLSIELAGTGIPMLWVTHDLAQMRRIADHVLALAEGRLSTAGRSTAYDMSRPCVGFLAGETGPARVSRNQDPRSSCPKEMCRCCRVTSRRWG